MSSTDKTYRNEFILPDNRGVGAINVAAENQGEPTLPTPTGWVQTALDSACVYLCGNSLGVCPKQSVALVREELEVWGKRCVRSAGSFNSSELNVIYSAVEGHFHHPHGRAWSEMVDHVHPLMAEIVGKNSPGVFRRRPR